MGFTKYLVKLKDNIDKTENTSKEKTMYRKSFYSQNFL